MSGPTGGNRTACDTPAPQPSPTTTFRSSTVTTTSTAPSTTPARPVPADRAARTAARSRRRRVALAAAPLLAVAGLAACSSGAAGAGNAAATTAPPAGAAEGAQASAVTVTDPWVKAVDTGMTAVFATLTNTGGQDVHIVSATTPASTSTELHEMATGASGAVVMRPKEGGFVIPAGGTHELSPGGDHLMLMSVTAPVLPGQDVTVTLTAEDGSTVDLTAPARSYSGADESYDGDGDGEADVPHGMQGVDEGQGVEGTHRSSTPATATP